MRYWLRAAGIGEDVIGRRASLVAGNGECKELLSFRPGPAAVREHPRTSPRRHKAQPNLRREPPRPPPGPYRNQGRSRRTPCHSRARIDPGHQEREYPVEISACLDVPMLRVDPAGGHVSEFQLSLAGVPYDQPAQVLLALHIQPGAPLVPPVQRRCARREYQSARRHRLAVRLSPPAKLIQHSEALDHFGPIQSLMFDASGKSGSGGRPLRTYAQPTG